jgi:hypothetical protein
MLETDLAQARESGSYSAGQLADQEFAVQRARDSVNMVRDSYRVMSAGSDIDKVAIEVHGPYMGAVQLTAVLAIKVVIVAAIVATAALVVMNVGKIGTSIARVFESVADGVERMVKDNPAGTILLFGLVATMIAVPFTLFKKPPVIVQGLPQKAEAAS